MQVVHAKAFSLQTGRFIVNWSGRMKGTDNYVKKWRQQTTWGRSSTDADVGFPIIRQGLITLSIILDNWVLGPILCRMLVKHW